MTKIHIFLLVIIVLVIATVVSCRKFEEYPPIPEIAFNDFELLVNNETGISEQGVLYISYRDGDGDIGLEQGDTLFPFEPGGSYYYNLLIRYFELQNGVFVEQPINFNARIPLLLPKDQKKGIKGIIRNEMFIYDPSSDFDTIQFTVQLIDRALNISNEITTPPIVRIVPNAQP